MKKYDVELVYEMNEEWMKHSDALNRLLGYSDDSGDVLGERDMLWTGLTKAKADAMIKKAKTYAKKHKIKGFTIAKIEHET